MKQYYIVAAAGVGKRMGLGYPKQFLEYKGKPLFIITAEKIAACDTVDGIIIVTNSEYIESVRGYIKEFNLQKVVDVVSGGKERQDSIYNGLKSVPCTDSIVGIQDGVRPFIEERFIKEAEEILKADEKIDGIVVGVKVKDTIKFINCEGDIENTPDRNFIVAAQTPQVFRYNKILECYEKAFENNFYGTDDSSLVEIAGGKVKYIDGSYNNIKITTLEDLKYLEEKR
jgi:2-C-methyl-D-erythritol 4-phosphate cytidylyltransferase